MAHFAELNENNLVTRVVVVNNDEIIDDGSESEAKGIAFCKSLFGNETKWKQTSYNASIRYNYAGVGFQYDAENDAFIAPKPFPSWNLNSAFTWSAPVAYPQDGKAYSWDEENRAWVEVK
jgi:hypothetical protein